MSPVTDLPTNRPGLEKEAAKLRAELSEARLAHSLQKLDSPARLRQLRRRLAQVLTVLEASPAPAAAPAKEKAAPKAAKPATPSKSKAEPKTTKVSKKDSK